MKKSTKKIITVCILALFIAVFCSFTAFAASDDTAADTAADETASVPEMQTGDNSTSSKAVAAACCVGVVSATAAIGMSFAISKSADGISRQPEAAGSIRTSLMLGLVFIETAIIYALIVGILIIFVL